MQTNIIKYYKVSEKELKEEELKDLEDLHSSIQTLNEISFDLNTYMETIDSKIETVFEDVEQTTVSIDNSTYTLEHTHNNSNLKMALTAGCTILGGSVLSLPLIPLIGGYSVITGICGSIFGGLLSKTMY